MNKKVIIVAAIVLILGIGGFFAATKFKTPPSTSPSSSSQPKANSLKDLLTAGVAQSCTFSGEGNTGTVYVASGKVRGDFDSTINGKTTKNHMLVDGNTSYIWMEGEKTGFKMSFDTSTQTATPGTTSKAASESFDANANMNYNCNPWVVDSSIFTLPAGIKFMEFAIPTPAPSGGSSSSSSQCSYCDTLAGDAKTQCRSALNCK